MTAPKDERQVTRLIERALAVIRQRNVQLDEMRRLILGEDAVYQLKGLPKPTAVKTMLVASQLSLCVGMAGSSKPQVQASIPRSIARAAKESAAQAESYLNNVFPFMALQHREPVYDALNWNQYALGFAVDAQDLYPARIYKGLPELDTAKPQDYQAAKRRILEQRGIRLGGYPIHWRSVNSERFYGLDSDEDDGLALGVEWRTRPLAEILDNPRYERGCPKLHAYYAALSPDDARVAATTLVDFWIAEDRDYTYYAVSGASVQQDMTQGQHLVAASGINAAMHGLELADVDPNPSGRVRYTVTPCFLDTAESETLRYQGLPYKMRHLARSIDNWYTIRLTRSYQHAAAAWVGVQEAIQTADGPAYAAQGDTDDPTDITLEPGGFEILPPGMKLQPVINPYNSPEEQALLHDLQGFLYAQGINPSIFENGDSGYSKAVTVNSTMVKFEPARNNTELAHYQRVQTHLAQLRVLQEKGLGIAIGGKDHEAAWYGADIAAWDELGLLIEPSYTLSAPQDEAANAQTALMLTQGGLLSYEDAYTDILHRQDWAGQQKKMRLENLEKSPTISQALDQQVLQQAGIEIQQEQNAQQNDVSAADLAGLPPDALQAARDMTPAGAPGYNAVQQATQGGPPSPRQGMVQNGIRQPQPAGSGDVVMPPPPSAGAPRGPIHGGQQGRAAGQKRRPPKAPRAPSLPGGGG